MAAAAALFLFAQPAAAEMVRLPGGTFVMGSDRGLPDERPAHPVTLRPFAIDRHLVTNADFARFLDRIGGTTNARGQHLFDWDDRDARIQRRNGRWLAYPGHERRPVVEATWYGARAYCLSLGKRLPTEAEWEFAARGREGRTYPWGEAPPDASRARYGMGYDQTLPVGSLPAGATPDGVFDLAGNVHEWTASLFLPYPYRADDGREDPERSGERVTRGGAYNSRPDSLRATWRGAGVSRAPQAGHHNIGFRCARDE